jgi:single-stranded DNA-binding protein
MIHPNAHTSLTGRIAETAIYNEKGYGTFILTVDLGEKFPWGRYHNYEIAFSTRYDKVSQYLTKGTSITCICTPYFDSWDDKYTGEKRFKHKYALESVHFNESDTSRKEKAAAFREAVAPALEPTPHQQAKANAYMPHEADEDYPF